MQRRVLTGAMRGMIAASSWSSRVDSGRTQPQLRVPSTRCRHAPVQSCHSCPRQAARGTGPQKGAGYAGRSATGSALPSSEVLTGCSRTQRRLSPPRATPAPARWSKGAQKTIVSAPRSTARFTGQRAGAGHAHERSSPYLRRRTSLVRLVSDHTRARRGCASSRSGGAVLPATNAAFVVPAAQRPVGVPMRWCGLVSRGLLPCIAVRISVRYAYGRGSNHG